MRRRTFSLLPAALMLSVLTVSPSTSATTVLSQSQIQSISAACTTIQSGLQHLQQSDRVLRVNLGQHYDSIARRLMAPLNSRIALNGLDGVDLAKTTVDFNAEFSTFQKDYSTYDTTLSDAMSTNCGKSPVDLYNAITNARAARQLVYADTQKLNASVTTFQQQFETFAAQQTTANTGGQ